MIRRISTHKAKLHFRTDGRPEAYLDVYDPAFGGGHWTVHDGSLPTSDYESTC
jgi:hypothetical protein